MVIHIMYLRSNKINKLNASCVHINDYNIINDFIINIVTSCTGSRKNLMTQKVFGSVIIIIHRIQWLKKRTKYDVSKLNNILNAYVVALSFPSLIYTIALIIYYSYRPNILYWTYCLL